MPICRICKAQLDKSKDDWIMPSKNYYYHKDCYNNWKNSKKETDAEWTSMIFDFLGKDLKVKYNKFMIDEQIKKYQKEHSFTVKGIYFALKYHYEIKKNKWEEAKGHGGIGIVPYVYQDSVNYWVEQERKKKGFLEALENQVKERADREVIKIKKPQQQKKKVRYELDDIGGEE